MTLLELPSPLARRASALAASTAPLALLVPRLLYGWSFHETGLGKLRNLEGTTQFFAGLGIPAPGAHAAAIGALEAAGGLALVAGLATRPVAALLSATMLVALATADRAALLDAIGGSGNLTDVVPLVYLAALVVLVAFGAGPISVDRLAQRVLRTRAQDGSAERSPLAPAPAARLR